ncbi:MAG: dUTP pyrophosphatase [Thermoanaerobacterium sp.]|nr:dUTP pyrophosphatase [Thermoanaerobacterium sp.]
MNYALKDMSITISGDSIQFYNNTLSQIIGDRKIRGFEKISFEQYVKDVGGERHELAEEYLDIKLPRRATAKSAGYDIYSPFSFELNPGETIKIPTGIKAYMQDDEVLKIYIRSSLGFKYDVTLSNNVGIIDADYANALNEGHIWIKLINHGDKTLSINKGEAIAQGIFEKYLKVDNDTPVKDERVGGIGSTNS